MLRISKWNVVAIVLAIVMASILVIPSLLPDQTREDWSKHLPSWLPMKVITLGLDLRGGSHVVLQIDTNDVLKTQSVNLRDDVRTILREEKAQITGGVGIVPRGVQLRLVNAADHDKVMARLRRLDLSAGLLGTGSGNYQIGDTPDGQIVMTLTDAGLKERLIHALDQAIEVLRHRIDGIGTKETSIQRQGDERIVVEIPGVQDTQKVKDILGTTAKLEFRFVAEAGANPNDYEMLTDKETNQKLPIMKQVIVSGTDLIQARAGTNQTDGAPAVDLQFNARGSERFAVASSQNIGKQFAIVLDNEVISAPVFRSAILGGQGQISGHFTSESASRLAVLLSSGTLPAKLTFEEQRTIGPGLGQDAINAGKNAAFLGTILVVLFMLITYGLFGLFANIALGIHVILIFAIMVLLGSTLTLPGIAGIVLTIGMAVDSNVLIYERIREEFKAGRNILASLDAGFNRAFATIVDSNVTMLIAAVILFLLGSGPVKGFAVTLALGIVTTIFTAVTMTRFMIALWYRYRRPSKLPI